jgi:hypothetical protein
MFQVFGFPHSLRSKTHKISSGLNDSDALGNRGLRVECVGVGHGLNADGEGAAGGDGADKDGRGFVYG